MAKLWTVGEIARGSGHPLHRVEYLIRARGIPFAGRAGRLRLFDADAVKRIVDELARGESSRPVLAS